jgi:hypothetical protein
MAISGGVSEQLAPSRADDEQHNQQQDLTRFVKMAAANGDRKLRAVAAHKGDEQIAKAHKADRIDHTGQPSKHHRQQQPAPRRICRLTLSGYCTHLGNLLAPSLDTWHGCALEQQGALGFAQCLGYALVAQPEEYQLKRVLQVWTTVIVDCASASPRAQALNLAAEFQLWNETVAVVLI